MSDDKPEPTIDDKPEPTIDDKPEPTIGGKIKLIAIGVALAFLIGGAIVGAIQNKHGSASALMGAVFGLGYALSLVAAFAIVLLGGILLSVGPIVLIGRLGGWIEDLTGWKGSSEAVAGAFAGAIIGLFSCYLLALIVLIVGRLTGWFDLPSWESDRIVSQVSVVCAIIGAIIGAIILAREERRKG